MECSWCSLHLIVVVLLCMCFGGGESLDDSLLPSGVIRDNILFDILWPGSSETDTKPDVDTSGQSSSEGEVTGKDRVDVEKSIAARRETVSPNSLLPESSYEETSFINVRTDINEQYHCVLPEIHSWEENEVGGAIYDCQVMVM